MSQLLRDLLTIACQPIYCPAPLLTKSTVDSRPRGRFLHAMETVIEESTPGDRGCCVGCPRRQTVGPGEHRASECEDD